MPKVTFDLTPEAYSRLKTLHEVRQGPFPSTGGTVFGMSDVVQEGVTRRARSLADNQWTIFRNVTEPR